MSARPIHTLLVANRGEIACRVMRTCASLGIRTVAVYSDADSAALHTRMAREAYRIGAPAPRDSYLRIGAIIDAARRSGACAIHPGYGFLAENAEFSAACRDAGLRFVGPSPEIIEAMGSKIGAKAIMRGAGVPVVPGYDGAEQTVDALVAHGLALGFPLLVKASAGGGGRGMRRVEDPAELRSAIEAARREAESAFGNGSLLLERWIREPRHVEVQILGDAYGHVVHCFERECSIQRRHQKIIEESPSTALSAETRSALCEAAVRGAQAIGYTNAGTFEFILDASGDFYFLEVNTRLQVEHPVTEALLGIDLVAAQIAVAEGRPAPLGAQPALTPKGAAVECRLCAEDPDHGFAPSAGRLLAWHTPRLEGVRVDSGVDTGSEVSTHYDSLLAKLIAWGPDRPSALRRMQHTLRNTVALGVVTNRKLLLETLALPDFQNGHIHTETLNNFLRDKPHRAPEAPPVRLAAFAALAEQFSARRAKATHLPSVSAGFRNSRLGPEEVVFEHQGHPVSLSYTPAGNNKLALVETPEPLEVEVVHRAPPSLRLRVADRLITANVAADGHRLWVALEEQDVFFDERPRFPELTDTRTAGGCVSPLPGRVARVLVSVGEAVDAGAAIAVVEAMKMEHTLHAAGAGIVEELHAEPGDSIAAGAPIATIRPNEPPTPTTCS